MIQHQFGYLSIILEKMYYGEFVDSQNNIFDLENTLGFYNADSIEDIESLIYEYFKIKDFDFSDMLPNKGVDACNALEQNVKGKDKLCVNETSINMAKEHDTEEKEEIYSPLALPDPLPAVLLEKDISFESTLERTIINLLQLEKKHVVKCLIRNAEIQKNDIDTRFMVGPFMLSLLDYIHFSTKLIDELGNRNDELKNENNVLWKFGDYVKVERCIPVKESIAVFRYFRCVLFELYQELLLIFEDVINRDKKRSTFYELYLKCFGQSPSKNEIGSYSRAVLLFHTERNISLYDEIGSLSLLGRLYSFYENNREDEQIQRAILRLENRIYWSQIHSFAELSLLDDWGYINKSLSDTKKEITKKIECETNVRNVIRILDNLNEQLQKTAFLFLPGSKLVDIEFSIVRNLKRWLDEQYSIYNGLVSGYLPVIDKQQTCNAITDIKGGYDIVEMKEKVKNILQYMSGTNREHDLIMTPTEYQYMIDCFCYFIDHGYAPKVMKSISCRLNIGVISYTLYILYKLIYPNDSSKRKEWLKFVCALFNNLPSSDELCHNFSRRSEEFLKYYFTGNREELIDYIRCH